MALGWFSKKSPVERVLERADRLAEQARWAEALSYYEEARDAGAEGGARGIRRCREELVRFNLAEAQAFATAEETAKAREHAELALQLAGSEDDLQAAARECLDELDQPAPSTTSSPKERLFAPTCSCSTPSCATTSEDAATVTVAGEGDEETLFEFYLEGLSPSERAAVEPLPAPFREGFVLLQQGETEQARPLLETARAENPEAVGVRYALGLLAALEENHEEALAHFAACLDVDSAFAPGARHVAETLREAGQSAKARDFLEQWAGENPADGEVATVLAACRLDAQDLEGALQAARSAAEQLPESDPRPGLLEARIRQAQGDDDGATQALQGVLARRPDLLEALVPLGQILLRRGGSAAERAAEVFKRCRQLDPERSWWHLLRIAQAYTVRGWEREAREVLEVARRELPETPEAREEWKAVSELAAG